MEHAANAAFELFVLVVFVGVAALLICALFEGD